MRLKLGGDAPCHKSQPEAKAGESQTSRPARESPDSQGRGREVLEVLTRKLKHVSVSEDSSDPALEFCEEVMRHHL